MRSLAFALAISLTATAAHAVDLTVRLDGVEPRGGSVQVGLFDSADNFARLADGVLEKQTVTADPDGTVVRFEGLPPGRYAVTAFHDANENGRFDKVLGLLPREGVALSNDPPLVSVPGFEDMAVEVTASQEITLRFRYLGG